jgi:hypothetical protein
VEMLIKRRNEDQKKQKSREDVSHPNLSEGKMYLSEAGGGRGRDIH